MFSTYLLSYLKIRGKQAPLPLTPAADANSSRIADFFPVKRK